MKRNMTEALLELHGHSRRVGLVEWHPTTNNILFSAGYDYKVSGPAAAGGGGEVLSLGATCKEHCYSPELVDQHCPICLFIHSFIHSLLRAGHRRWAHHCRGPQRPSLQLFWPLWIRREGPLLPTPSSEPLLKSRSGCCPLDGKKEQPKLLEGREGHALPRGVPATGPWPGTRVLLARSRN